MDYENALLARSRPTQNYNQKKPEIAVSIARSKILSSQRIVTTADAHQWTASEN